MKKILVILALLMGFAVQAQDVLEVFAPVETVPSEGDGASGVAVWLHPTDLSQSVVIGGDNNEGIGVYALDGSLVQFDNSNGGISAVDIRYNFGSDKLTLIAGAVADQQAIMLYTLDSDTRQLQVLTRIETGIPMAALCLYQSPLTNTTYIFAMSEDGALEQYALKEDDNDVTATLRRALSVGGEVEACAVDDNLRRVYISEGSNLVWRYGAEPEDGINRSIVDFVGGNISEEMEGLTVYAVADNAGYLIITNEKNDSFLVYERTGDNQFVGEFSIGANDVADKVSEPTGVAIANLPLNDQFPQGLFITSDDVNSTPNGDNNFKLVSWADVATGLGLTVDTTFDPRTDSASNADVQSTATTVTAELETEPVPLTADSADDPAIWIHPTNPDDSLIIGTDKRNGLVVYGLDGSILQTVNIGRVNNVDLRYNFPLGGETVALVGATNRTEGSLVLYAVNPETRELVDVRAEPILSQVEEVYGFCMYYSAIQNKFYAFINSADTGEVEQYELSDNGNGKVTASVVRQFVVGSQTEGCVVDDENATLYLGEEGVGFWKYSAEPDADDTHTMVDGLVEDGGHLTADVEGIALYTATGGAGYLIVSSQGSSEFVVYDRQGDNAYVGTFRVVETDTVDAISGTDGLDVTNFALGTAFPDGVLVIQDDLNLNPAATQNFKFVSWKSVADALGLATDTTFDPRTIGQ